MKPKMGCHNLKSRVLPVLPIGAAIICLLVTAQVPASAGTKSDEMVDRINKAISDAEKKLGSNPVVEEVRKDIRTNLTPARQSAPVVKTQPVRQAPPALSPARASGSVPSQTPPAPSSALALPPQEDAAPFRSAVIKTPKQQAQEIAWQADRAYFGQGQYEDGYELAEQSLKIDPENRKAKFVQHRINKALEKRPMDLGGKDRTISPPEGKIALTVAMSDNLVTLSEAEDIGVKNSLMLESLRHRVLGARRKVDEALRAFFPTASLEFSGGGGLISEYSYHSQRAMMNFSQPVFYGGELMFTLRQAKASLRADELRYQKERTDVVRQVGEAYRNSVNAVYNLEYQNELFKQISEFKIRQDKAYESELVPEIDKLEMTSIYNQVAFQKETAVTTQKSANLTLCQAIGVNADQPIPVDPSIEVGRLKAVDLEQYLNRVGTGNFDIRIRQATLEGAYYAAVVFDAQKLPRVDLRGNWGWSGESRNVKLPEDQLGGDNANVGPFSLDTEKEEAIIATVSVPWGPNTTSYSYQRRFFAPTVSSFQGSEDYKHAVTTSFFDRMSNMTDEELAKAEYLKTMAELQKERTDQEINARQAYYDYENALLQLETSTTRIVFRERQVKILEQTTQMEEAKLTELLNELVSLAEDRYSKVAAVSSANNALAKMDYLAGMEGMNTQYDIQPAKK